MRAKGFGHFYGPGICIEKQRALGGVVRGVSAVSSLCCVHDPAGKGRIYHIRTRLIPSLETDLKAEQSSLFLEA